MGAFCTTRSGPCGFRDERAEERRGGDDDGRELLGLLDERVAALERARALDRRVDVDDEQVLAREDERGGAVLALDGAALRVALQPL